jgi:hypothetical protein
MAYPDTFNGGVEFVLAVARGIAAKTPPGGGWAGGMREMVETLERAIVDGPGEPDAAPVTIESGLANGGGAVEARVEA